MTRGELRVRDCYPCRNCGAFVDVSPRIRNMSKDSKDTGLIRDLLHSVYSLSGTLCDSCYAQQERTREKHDE